MLTAAPSGSGTARRAKAAWMSSSSSRRSPRIAAAATKGHVHIVHHVIERDTQSSSSLLEFKVTSYMTWAWQARHESSAPGASS
jgi:hypothetical protein